MSDGKKSAGRRPDLKPRGGDGADVSVIVPVRNGAALLGNCLSALLRQETAQVSIEVIVVDNDSEDDTAAIARSMAVRAPFPMRILSEPVRGSYRARNRGAGRARGRYLLFTDADARPDPRWVERMVAGMERENADLAAGAVRWLMPPKPTLAALYDRFRSLSQRRYVGEGFAATVNFGVRRETFKALNGFDQRLKSGGDRDFGLRATQRGFRLVYLEEACVAHLPRQRVADVLRKAQRVGLGLGRNAQMTGNFPWKAIVTSIVPFPWLLVSPRGRTMLRTLPMPRRPAFLGLDIRYRWRLCQGFITGWTREWRLTDDANGR